MATATASRRTAMALAFTISREKLQEGLAAVVPSTPAKSTLPVLANILIESSNRGITMSGTDLDISVTHEIAADVTGAGKMTVPAKRLQQIAKELAPAPVRIALAASGVVKIECGRANYTLRTLPDDEFPMLPNVEFGTDACWSIRAGDLQSLAKRTAFCASTEESRPVLNGVLVDPRGGTLRLVASDGHRMARVDAPIEGGMLEADPHGAELILPPRALDFISRLFPEDEEVDVARTENHLSFRTPSTRITTRLIEGPYPPVERIIPKKHPRSMQFDRLAMISSIRRMVPIVSGKTHRLVMTIKPAKIELRAKTPDIGEAYDELPAKLDGDSETIGVNAAYLLEILGKMTCDEVIMWSGNPDKVLLIRPAQTDEKITALYLCMPLRVND